ncbi:MAG: hypothetical protein JW896_01075 [Deltaproteobacteria bacterium]|nr:hypothetical protein [Deltaproteobacteria bacterium]
MNNFLRQLVLALVVISTVGCVTVRDIQRGTDIIRTDNELARILNEKQLDKEIPRRTELIQIGDHAKKGGDALKKMSGQALDALAYYRIAATAYWKSNDPNVTNRLFAVYDHGIEICNALGGNAPDRDCLFLELVIPLSGFESFIKDKQISALLERVRFSDGTATKEEIKNMNKAGALLNEVKPRVESILAIARDERLLTHPGMHEYYCDNAKEAKRLFDGRTGTFESKVFQFESMFPNHDPPLEMSLEEVQTLSQLENELPASCVQ